MPAKHNITTFIIWLLLLLGIARANAEDSFVTLWAGNFATTNELSTVKLTLNTNETACLVSWPQLEFRSSFLTVNSGMNSVLMERKPEIMVNEKTKSVKENGALPMPEVVIAGPATLELSVNSRTTIFCTFRIVHNPSTTITPGKK